MVPESRTLEINNLTNGAPNSEVIGLNIDWTWYDARLLSTQKNPPTLQTQNRIIFGRLTTAICVTIWSFSTGS